MAYTFISYSTKNQAKADAIRAILQENGIDVWMAPGSIPVGEKYASAINQAIRNCACFMLLLSNDSQSSTWVAKEVERAVNYGKIIMPIKLEEVTLNDEFEFYISNAHIVSLFDVQPDSAVMKKILKVVQGHLKNDAKASENPPQQEAPIKKTIEKTSQPTKPTVAKPVKTPNASQGIKYKNGDTYTGPLIHDKRNGKGKYLWKNGDCYVGDFVNDKRSGRGKITWKNGNSYQGDFINDKISGKGKYTWKNGETYVGDFINDKRSGKGKFTWKNGDVYVGDYVDDKRAGKGKLTYSNGNVYQGDFSNDKRHGKGRFVWANGNVYVGDFINDKRHGKGKFTWANGDSYQGDFVDDKRNGKGKYVWANGNVYVGDFVNDKRTGLGKLTYANGKVQNGRFVDNKFIG